MSMLLEVSIQIHVLNSKPINHWNYKLANSSQYTKYVKSNGGGIFWVSEAL